MSVDVSLLQIILSIGQNPTKRAGGIISTLQKTQKGLCPPIQSGAEGISSGRDIVRIPIILFYLCMLHMICTCVMCIMSAMPWHTVSIMALDPDVKP